MNKAVMISIAPKWWAMIKNGTKKLEFRNYGIPKGTKVYLRETLGKLVSCNNCIGHKGMIPFKYHEFTVDYEPCSCTDLEPYNKDGYIYEGTGLVVGEFIVGEKYTLQQNANGTVSMYYGDISNFLDNEPLNKPRAILGNQGYTNQSHAHTITDLIVYDEEWIRIQQTKMKCVNLRNKDMNVKYYNKLVLAPTSPIHWNEFVSWNKYNKYKDYILDYNCNLKYPNQGRIYVVEKEWK